MNTIHDDQNMKYWARRNFSRLQESIHLSIVLHELNQYNSMETIMLGQVKFLQECFNYTIGYIKREKEHILVALAYHISLVSESCVVNNSFIQSASRLVLLLSHHCDLGTVQIICIVVKKYINFNIMLL